MPEKTDTVHMEEETKTNAPDVAAEPEAGKNKPAIKPHQDGTSEDDDITEESIDIETHGMSIETRKAAEEPELAVEEPEVAVEEPEVAVEEPEVAVEEPEVAVEEPEAAVEEPEVAVEEPEVAVEEPEVAVEEPEAAVEEPEVAVEEPEVAVEEPEVAEEESEVAEEAPEEFAEEPEMAGKEPEAADEPRDVVEDGDEEDQADAVIDGDDQDLAKGWTGGDLFAVNTPDASLDGDGISGEMEDTAAMELPPVEEEAPLQGAQPLIQEEETGYVNEQLMQDAVDETQVSNRESPELEMHVQPIIPPVSGDQNDFYEDEAVETRDEPDLQATGMHDVPEPVSCSTGEEISVKNVPHTPPVLPPDYTILLEEMRQSAAELRNLLAAVNQTSSDTRKISALVENQSDQTQQLLEWTSDTKIVSAISKTFLLLASLAVLAIALGQVYSFTNMVHTQRRQDKVEESMAKALGELQKRDAEHEKEFVRILGEEVHKERERLRLVSLAERLNRLRNGATEQKVLRKESGDWFILGKKSQEVISDSEIVEALNASRQKSSAAKLQTLPPHDIVCVLCPDGKGGTKITTAVVAASK